jgi:hypothetical protein
VLKRSHFTIPEMDQVTAASNLCESSLMFPPQKNHRIFSNSGM